MGLPVWRFGRCEMRPATRELLIDGRPQRLGERAWDLLLALVEADGRPVARDALFERVWPGRAVLEDNLKVQVMALRRLLGPEAVVTVPGQGYRLGLRRVEATAAVDLFGREADLERLLQRLAPGRLLTLVGPGGIGKTRLALAAAARAGPADGTLVVELASLADPRALPGTVARALALPPGAGEAALLAALKPLALRLVLDNAEHLHDAVAALAGRVLAAAPGVTLLVTSQEPLGLADEQVLRLEGLAVPVDDSDAAIAASPAAALFAARAAALGHAPGPGEAAVLARLCRRLDGIPLALELAAARVPMLGLAGVERHLDEALALLTRGRRDAPPRQQTLRAALQWSHGLLDEAQKRVFRRLAVCAGGFTPDLAQAVAGAGEFDRWAVLDPLESLVAKSLVQMQVQGDGRRFRLLETTRAFALERLADAGETAATQRRHAEAMAARFEAADAAYAGAPVLPWLRALQPELDNLRAAVDWALGVDGDEALAIRLCAAAGGFWAMTGLHAESAPPLKRLAPKVDERVPPATRALFWLTVANRSADGSFSVAETHAAAERAIAIAREAGLPELQYRALSRRLPLALRVGAPADAAATAAEMRALEGPDWTPAQRRPRLTAEGFGLFERGEWARLAAIDRRELAVLRAAGDLYRAWFAAHRLALALTALGEAEEAVGLMQTAVDEIRAEGLLRHCWQQVALLAMTRIEAGDAPAAAVHEAVRLMQGAGAVGWMACHLAEWLAQRRRWPDAARLLGWAASRGPADPHSQRARGRAEAALARAADAARLAAWRREGEAWTDDEVVAALLAVG